MEPRSDLVDLRVLVEGELLLKAHQLAAAGGIRIRSIFVGGPRLSELVVCAETARGPFELHLERPAEH